LQVDAALTTDPDNEDLLKLKSDLQVQYSGSYALLYRQHSVNFNNCLFYIGEVTNDERTFGLFLEQT